MNTNRGDNHKHDTNKPMWDLLPLDMLEDTVRVLTFGATKYTPDGWKTVPYAKARYWAALMRHLKAHQSGEVIDQETGLPHLAHASCNLLFIQWFEKNQNNQ